MPLKDKWIVITRPKHQAQPLRRKLEEAGANVLLFPLLEIVPPDDPITAKQKLSQLQKYHLLIFTSANAVNFGLKWLNKSDLSQLKVAAIGKKTASLLRDKHIYVDYFPLQKFNSEALLALPEIQSYGDNKRIVIIRGQNGREYLKEKLEKQGAIVDYIDVYKRILPQGNTQIIHQQYLKKQLDMIIITSESSLQNLFSFLPENQWLNKTPLLLGSQRIHTLMPQAYPNYQGKLLITTDPMDETIYQKLLKYFSINT